jgi:phosphate-selective porin OprO/OprP
MKLALIAVLLAWAGVAGAQQAPAAHDSPPPTPDDMMKRELDELRARQKELEKRLEAAELRALHPAEPPPAPMRDVDNWAPRFRFGKDGAAISTADGKNEVRIRAVLHVDGRAFFGGTQPIPDTFLIRRARPMVEGTLFGIVDFRIMPDFAQGQSMLADGYIELKPWSWLKLRAGKFRSPIGLEWLQSDSQIIMVERSLVTDLVPWRDLGLMLHGDIANSTFTYQIAVFNGAPDSTNGPDFDPQSEKDYVARFFLRPLRALPRITLADIGFGIAGSYGQLAGTSAQTNLPTYRSTGQQNIFSYLNSPTAPDSVVTPLLRYRISPQAFVYVGPFGLLAEYALSGNRVRNTLTQADLTHQAWNLTATFMLTQERASFDGPIPRHPVDFKHLAFGAFEVAFRYSEIHFDDAAFPTWADPTTSVRTARELAGGLNWYLNEHVRFMFSFMHTDFDGGAVMGNRDPENALLGRLQICM